MTAAGLIAEEVEYAHELAEEEDAMAAVDRLVDLIKENGKWFDAPVPVAAS